MDGYYIDKIKEMERKESELNRVPVCYTCKAVIDDIISRSRILEAENHEIFKIFFHYFPPCFHPSKCPPYCHIIIDAYTIETDYLIKNTDIVQELSQIEQEIW